MTGMTFALTRLMSAATASYGAYALIDPSHLGKFVDPKHADSYDTLAQTYGARDLILSAVAMKGRSQKTVTAAAVVRILSDLSDAAILSPKAHDDDTRKRLLGVTVGWAGLNALALVIDRRRAQSSA
jgi:hypothetical protein